MIIVVIYLHKNKQHVYGADQQRKVSLGSSPKIFQDVLESCFRNVLNSIFKVDLLLLILVLKLSKDLLIVTLIVKYLNFFEAQILSLDLGLEAHKSLGLDNLSFHCSVNVRAST